MTKIIIGKIGAVLAAALLFLTACGGPAGPSVSGSPGQTAENAEETNSGSAESLRPESSGGTFGEAADPDTASADHKAEDYRTEIELGVSADGIQEATQYIFAMDTEMTITAYGKNAEEAVLSAGDEVLRIDRMLSVGIADSEISVLNRDGEAEVSDLTLELIVRGLAYCRDTDGAFDITVFPLMEEWGFTSGQYHVPDQQVLNELLQKTGPDKVQVDDHTVTLSEGTKLDLGGIAKGYTSTRLMEIFEEHGVDAALVSLGGNVQTYGTKANGGNWNIAIRDPDGGDTYLGIVSTHDKAVITSGGYERCFEEDGVTYHHILDPADGYPAENGIKSMSIVSSDGTYADALSTALFVMGREKAEEYWRTRSGQFDFILETDSGEIEITEGLADCFQSDHEYSVVTR